MGAECSLGKGDDVWFRFVVDDDGVRGKAQQHSVACNGAAGDQPHTSFAVLYAAQFIKQLIGVVILYTEVGEKRKKAVVAANKDRAVCNGVVQLIPAVVQCLKGHGFTVQRHGNGVIFSFFELRGVSEIEAENAVEQTEYKKYAFEWQRKISDVPVFYGDGGQEPTCHCGDAQKNKSTAEKMLLSAEGQNAKDTADAYFQYGVTYPKEFGQRTQTGVDPSQSRGEENGSSVDYRPSNPRSAQQQYVVTYKID